MTKIDLTMYPDRLERTVQRVRERNIIIPTFEQMRNPSLVPEKIKEELKGIGLWDIHPRNLFGSPNTMSRKSAVVYLVG